MAAVQIMLLSFPEAPVMRSYSSSSSSAFCFPEFLRKSRGMESSIRFRSPCVAMVSEQGAPVTNAKEIQRLSARESLLLAIKDSGGFEAIITGKTTEVQRIDVNERIIGLERLNPTPRPTTSPFLEGKWNFAWFGSASPGLLAARLIFERLPSSLANLTKMDAVIKDGYVKITAHLKLLNSIESKVILSTKLSVEGPLRMKEVYVDGTFETPSILEETVPDQLKGALGQATSTMQQIRGLFRDVIDRGFKVPLSGTFQRLFFISYLDDEIVILRNDAGLPEVLSRLDAPPVLPEPAVELES